AVFAQGCAYRAAAMDALDGAGRAWRVAYSSNSVAGVQAAAMTGLAIGVLPQSTLLKGMRVLDEGDGLPPLPDYAITLHAASGSRPAPVARLADDIAAQLALPLDTEAPMPAGFAAVG
ncbi:MAG: LysR substrate-binding domain-containing protein, partial [Kiloniellales bacterium]